MYNAGSAKVDITPPLTIPYLGGLPRHSLFDGVHDRLYARAVAVTDVRLDRTIILITVDAIGLNNDILGPGRDFTREVRDRISLATQVPGDHVMVGSSHAHSTPETGDFRHLYERPGGLEWVEGLRDDLVHAAVQAVRCSEPVTAKYAANTMDGGPYTVNRDSWVYPDPARAPIDSEIGVLVLRNEAGTRRTVLVSAVCHPVIVQITPYVSADFPGVAADFVERNMADVDVCMFLQGACGQINPLPDELWTRPKHGPDNRPDRVSVRDGFAHCERVGLALGMTAVDLAATAPGTPVCGPVKAVAEKITVASRDLPDRTPYQEEYDRRDRAVQEAIDRGAGAEEVVALRHARQEYEEYLAAIDRGTDPIQAEVQGLRFGNVAFVGLPGEPFVEYGLGLKAMSTDGRTVVPVGYANDYLGYFMPAHIWDTGVYESALGCHTRMGRAAGDAIYAKAQQLVTDLWTTTAEEEAA